jgi:nitrate/nitrite-specific signal transduction histidine kinase
VFGVIDPARRINFNFVNEQGEEFFAIAEWSSSTEIALGIKTPTGNLFSANPSTASILVISIILITTIAVLVIIWVTNRMLQPLSSLTELARRMTQGDWNFRVAEDRNDELGYLAKSLNRMARELGALYQSLEGRVEDRTKQIRIASEVARAVISIPNLDELLRQAVKLIKNRFGYDHVSIFLIDREGDNAVLRESSSEEKEALKTVGYKLKIGSPSMVGMVTESNEPIILSGAGNEPDITMDELLPGARSEVAIPLQVAGNSLGALAIQSYARDAFKTEDIEVLQTLADQLSAAIENARLAQVSTNAAERARLVSEITSQISGLMDPGHVLQTTAKALHNALGEAEIIIDLVSPSDDMEEIA